MARTVQFTEIRAVDSQSDLRILLLLWLGFKFALMAKLKCLLCNPSNISFLVSFHSFVAYVILSICKFWLARDSHIEIKSNSNLQQRPLQSFMSREIVRTQRHFLRSIFLTISLKLGQSLLTSQSLYPLNINRLQRQKTRLQGCDSR